MQAARSLRSCNGPQESSSVGSRTLGTEIDTGQRQKPRESGAAALMRQSGSILDVATALCSRSNTAIGFVSQHRVLSLMEGLCRTANSCKAGLVVGALRIACDGLCTAARFHAAEENPGCLLGCHDGLDCIRHHNRCSAPFESICSLWPGTGECIAPTALFNELLFKLAVGSDKVCILVAVLLDALCPAYNLVGLNRQPWVFSAAKRLAFMFKVVAVPLGWFPLQKCRRRPSSQAEAWLPQLRHLPKLAVGQESQAIRFLICEFVRFRHGVTNMITCSGVSERQHRGNEIPFGNAAVILVSWCRSGLTSSRVHILTQPVGIAEAGSFKMSGGSHSSCTGDSCPTGSSSPSGATVFAKHRLPWQGQHNQPLASLILRRCS